MSAKVITKKSRKSVKDDRVESTADIPVDERQAVIDNFPTGKPRLFPQLPPILDKTRALNTYTDKNSMLYVCNQVRSKEQSLFRLTDWEQVLRESE